MEAVAALRPGQNEHCLMNSIRALIVDDSSVMRKIVERSLRQAGIDLKQVLEAGSVSITMPVSSPATPKPY